MAEYFVKVKDQYNKPITNISDFYKLELFRGEFGFGSLYLDLPLKKYHSLGFKIDWRLEVYRKSGTGPLVRIGNTQWFVKLVRNKVDEQNKEYLHLLAYDPLQILHRRIVAYVAGTSYALKEDMNADDMMKAILRENIGAKARDGTRDLSQWLIIEEDKGQAPKVTLDDFAFQQILPLLGQICEKSEAAGTYLSFDIEYDDALEKLVFKTYTGQRGANRGRDSLTPLYLSHYTDYVNVMGDGLNYASVETDATDEVTFVYSGKATEETNNFFVTLANQSTINTSPFGRLEDYITTGDSLNYNDMIVEAKEWLQHKHRFLRLNAHVQQDSNLQFGRDYDFGDLVLFRYGGETYSIHLDEFRIVVGSNGAEDITVASNNMEREIVINVPDYPAYDAVIKNERIEDEDNIGVPLFYKHHSVAQSFVLSGGRDTLVIKYIDVMMRRLRLPQKNVSMSLYTGDANKPITEITNPVIVPYDFIPDGLYAWIRFEFRNPVTIIKNTNYWIVLSCGLPKTEYDNYYRIGVEKEHRYSGGVFKVSPNGTTWSSTVSNSPDKEEEEEVGGSNFDMIFAVGSEPDGTP